MQIVALPHQCLDVFSSHIAVANNSRALIEALNRINFQKPELAFLYDRQANYFLGCTSKNKLNVLWTFPDVIYASSLWQQI